MQYFNPDIESSFFTNNVGSTLYEFILDNRYSNVIELGVLNGYSSAVILQALSKLGVGNLISIDLFELYPFNNCSLVDYRRNISPFVGNNKVNHTIIQMDILSSMETVISMQSSADMAFIDLSNDASLLEPFLKNATCPILFEGGSIERDQIYWMQKYEKKPITSLPAAGYNYQILDNRFPSLSLYNHSSNIDKHP